MSSKIISASDGDDIAEWSPPNVGQGNNVRVQSGYQKGGPVTASQLQKVHDEAVKDGFEQGYREGLRKGEKDAFAQNEVISNHLVSIIKYLENPLHNLDEQVEHSLVQLALSVGQHIVRRELKIDPGQVIAVIREAVALLPVSSPGIQIYLHPEDASLIKDKMTVNEQDSQWHIIEDPALTRGGCRVVSQMSQVDASVENRLAAIVAKVMGDERDN